MHCKKGVYLCVCVTQTKRQQCENGLLVVGQRCKQTVGKKATSYIIEGDVKASSLQGCQCQEAEPGWEQRAPPCCPLQRAAIYIVNTHFLTLCLSFCPSHTYFYVFDILFLFLSHSSVTLAKGAERLR